MEKTATIKRWLKYKWIAILLIAGIAYGAHHIYKEYTMPPPLVYLIHEDYVGPVFVFFGHPDGVELMPDPLGHAVKVPGNGLVKLRASVDEAIPSNEGGTKQAIFWVSVSKESRRRNFVFSLPETGHNEKDEIVEYYLDSNLHIQTFIVNDNLSPFYYFTEAQKNERMILNHGGCKHQRFIPVQESDSKEPSCGKFLVMSPNELQMLPNEFGRMPSWIWHDLSGKYTSIQELEKNLNEVVEKKKTFYSSPGK